MRQIILKDNDVVTPCPKCSNNTKLNLHSQQVQEDGCELWTTCGKCDYDPFENMWGCKIEDVWGGTSEWRAFIYYWNEQIEEVLAKVK